MKFKTPLSTFLIILLCYQSSFSKSKKQISIQTGEISTSSNETIEITFTEAWNSYKETSKKISASEDELTSSKIAKIRSDRHWYPRIMLDSKAYLTNDPGQILFSKLGERSIDGTDFNPTIMNFPTSSLHEKTSIIIDFPIYEGGRPTRYAETLSIQTETKELQSNALKIEEYSKVYANYAMLIALKQKKDAILPLKNIIESTLSKYQLGQQGNQLGYSGLLGLKNLKNRVNGELQMIEAQNKSIHIFFSENTRLPENWTPKENNTFEFYKFNHEQLENTIHSESFIYKAMLKASESLIKMADIEDSRFLPKIGGFADQSFYNSHETNFSNSQTIGVYLQWELFSANNFDSKKQVLLQAYSAKKMAEAEKIRQHSELKKNKVLISALENQLKLADESLKFLEEQSEISKKLFNNGLINVLQLIEVYSRRIDVIVAKSTMKENVIKSQAEILNFINTEI